MQAWVDSNDGAPERPDTRPFDPVWLTVQDDRPANLVLKTCQVRNPTQAAVGS